MKRISINPKVNIVDNIFYTTITRNTHMNHRSLVLETLVSDYQRLYSIISNTMCSNISKK